MTVPSSSSPLRRVLVLGAGWLGRPLADALAADGVFVTTVRRSPHTPPAGGVAVALDLRELGAPDAPVPSTLHDHDAVVALVAPDRRRGDDHSATYPAAARAAVRVAQAIGARACCWISSTGVYGYADGREVHEDTPLAATEPSQRALIDAEQIVRGADSAALVTGVLRVAGLYGPDRDPAGRYRDVASLTGRLTHWVNLAWRDDVIAAIRVWLTHALGPQRDATPRVLNVADGTPLLVSECARLVALAEGRPFTLPTPDAAAASAGAPSPMRSNQRVQVHALRALGWRPTVPHLRAGLLRLGYARLAADQPPYGPQTAALRVFLQRLAALDAESRSRVLAAWATHREDAAFRRAERLLGEVMARSGREAERDAVAGPLLQMLRRPVADATPEATGVVAPQPADDPLASLDPIAEPALAALLALLVRDLLPDEAFGALTAPCGALIPD